jgi:hypothetical protein
MSSDVNNDVEGIWKEAIVSVWGTILDLAWIDGGILRKVPVRMSGLRVEVSACVCHLIRSSYVNHATAALCGWNVGALKAEI